MMPSDLEQRLRDSLAGRAAGGSPIDPAPLLRDALDRGRASRARRRIFSSVAVAAAVVLASVLGLTVLRPSSIQRHPAGGGSSASYRANLGTLPVPEGVPGAAADPSLVATDPRLVHFDVDALASAARRVTWRSTDSYESANVQREDFQAYVAVARDREALPPPDSFSASEKERAEGTGATWSKPSAVDMGAITGTLTVGTPRPIPGVSGRTDIRIWSLIWQPRPGLWVTVEVQTTSLDQAMAVARQVSFDRATRCALPFRIGSPPPGATLRSCEVSLLADHNTGFANANLTYSDGARSLELLVMPDSDPARDYPGSLRAGPYRVEPDPDGRTYTMMAKPLFFTAVVQAESPRYSRAEVLDVLGSMSLVGTPKDPATFE